VRSALAILAAGGSTRAGVDKIVADLGGRPVLAWSLAAAEAADCFDEVVVVAPHDKIAVISRIVGERSPRARVIAGGATRTASSWAALDALTADVISIHDAARPFVPQSLFARCVRIAIEKGSAIAGLPLADTVRRADEAGAAVEEVTREGLWSAQTPQAFRRELLRKARDASGDRAFSDDAAALVAAGFSVQMVMGERRNLKITTLEDLAYARELVDKGLVAIPALQLR
jgi:2-C-methyl-D-erythritol 4-phosphate cytidylyltransferase